MSGTDSTPFQIPLLVGITGHRDLVPAQLADIRLALTTVFSALRHTHPEVRIELLSSMADGADLLAADVARELDLKVVALLPYAESQCRADLESDAARATFDRVMRGAERLELSLPAGTVPDDVAHKGPIRDRQYQRAGALIAQYCSLLVAVWDGEDTYHAAGTARVIQYRRRGIAIIDDEAATARDTLLSAADNDLTYEIRCARLSTQNGNGNGNGNGNAVKPVEVRGFVGTGIEPQIAGLPQRFSALLANTAEFNRDVADFGAKIATRSRRLSPPTPGPLPAALNYVDRLFTASDWLGVHFRRCYTLALRVRYALWAALAFLLLAFKKESVGIMALALILGVLLTFALGGVLALWAQRRNWHRKYLDYRALAEGLRVEYYWELSGVRSQFDGEFAHESFLQKQDFELEWIRAAMRAVSLRCAMQPRGRFEQGFAHTFAAWVGDPDPFNGSGQLQYYRLRSHALERRQHVAEAIARVMLFGGLALAAVFAVDVALGVLGRTWLAPTLRWLLLWALALLTVYGAIFEIYLAEKADRALIRQYRYMDSLFSFAATELSSARSEAQKLDILRSLGHACLAEHAQWILAHREKQLEGLRL